MDTQAEIEDRAKVVLKRAGMDLFMELESLAVCRESNRVFIVLKGKGAADGTDRAPKGSVSDLQRQGAL